MKTGTTMNGSMGPPRAAGPLRYSGRARSLILRVPSGLLAGDRPVGPKTIAAIREFQHGQLGFNDGRVDPGNKTITRLNGILANNSAPVGGRGSAFAITGAPAAPPAAPATPATPT